MNRKAKLLIASVTLVLASITTIFLNLQEENSAQSKTIEINEQNSDTQPIAEIKSAPPRSQPKETEKKNAVKATEKTKIDPQKFNLEDRALAMSFRRGGEKFDIKELAETVSLEKGWTQSSTVYTDLGLSDEQVNDGRVFLEGAQLKIETLFEGDEVVLPLPFEGKNIRFKIDQVNINKDMIQWKGSGEEVGSRFSVFSADTAMAGTLESQGNHYTFEFHDGRGWIQRTRAMYDPNPNVADTIHVETPGEMHNDSPTEPNQTHNLPDDEPSIDSREIHTDTAVLR